MPAPPLSGATGDKPPLPCDAFQRLEGCYRICPRAPFCRLDVPGSRHVGRGLVSGPPPSRQPFSELALLGALHTAPGQRRAKRRFLAPHSGMAPASLAAAARAGSRSSWGRKGTHSRVLRPSQGRPPFFLARSRTCPSPGRFTRRGGDLLGGDEGGAWEGFFRLLLQKSRPSRAYGTRAGLRGFPLTDRGCGTLASGPRAHPPQAHTQPHSGERPRSCLGFGRAASVLAASVRSTRSRAEGSRAPRLRPGRKWAFLPRPRRWPAGRFGLRVCSGVGLGRLPAQSRGLPPAPPPTKGWSGGSYSPPLAWD